MADPEGNGDSALAAALRRLRVDAGTPSTRQLATISGVSHSAIAQILRGTAKFQPSWSTVSAIVRALGGDQDMFAVLWHDEYVPEEGRTGEMPSRMPSTVAEELRGIRGLLERIVDLMEKDARD